MLLKFKLPMKKLFLLPFLAISLFLITGCRVASRAPVSNEPILNTTQATQPWLSHSGTIFNSALGKSTSISFQFPPEYLVAEGSIPPQAPSTTTNVLYQIQIRGPKGRVEIFNDAYYDGLPAPEENPSPERQKELDEQLPKIDRAVGYEGEFSEYGFYGAQDQVTAAEIQKIIDSISFKDLSDSK